MERPGNRHPLRENRLKRLAKDIDALADKDEARVQRAAEIARLRQMAASELHRLCADFVSDLNGILERGEVLLDPPEWSFRDEGTNLIQINTRGRILQIAFEATAELSSSEDFRIPYTLSGSIRAFNQELLEKHLIEEQLIFYTLEREKGLWRFFDARTYRSGPLDEEYLISLMEQLV